MKPAKLLSLALVIWMMVTQTLFAQNFKDMTLLGNFGKGEGESLAVFAAGSLVFYGLGSKVVIASFTDPTAPVKIASVELTDVIQSMVRTSINSTQYLVVTGGSKMWIINVQSPVNPSLTATVDVAPGTTCEGVATSGSYAYVAAGASGLRIYNIATPSSPTFVASIDSLAYCESVVISAPYAFIAADDESFTGRSFIVDISTPSAPVWKSTILGYGGYHQYMNVRSGYAYICDYNAGLQVINVADVSNPVNVTTVASGYRTAGIIFDGNYAYVAVGDPGMNIYDVSSPGAPAFVSNMPTTGRAAFVSYGAVTVGGSPKGHIFISNRATASGLSGINVSVPATPTLSAFISALPAASGSAFAPFYAGGKAYVAYGSAGLRIIDVSNPNAVTLLSTTTLGGDSRGVVASGNYVYVAARDSGMYVVDATTVGSPTKLPTLKITRANGLTIQGNYVYVAAADSGLAIVDISAPATPSVVGYFHPGGQYGENVAVSGNVLGLTDYGKILFFDITSPAAPVEKGTTASFKVGNEGFAIDGNHAYVPDGDSLRIFDITDLMAPAQVSAIRTGGYGYMAAVAGSYCYVASEGTGVRGINITDPSAPVEDAYYDGVPQSRGVTANGSYVYVAEKIDGLSVYRNDLVTSVSGPAIRPQIFTLRQNYPNPFNPSTTIGIDLSEKAFVQLEVFNLLGQKVAVLLNRQMPAGSFTVPFDATALPTGLYIYRMQLRENPGAEALSFSRKMLLIK